VNGVSETSFNPGGSMTRGQFATTSGAWLSLRSRGEAIFTDLTQDYYKNAIAWCQENGVVNGKTETTFDPDSPIKRQEIIAIIYRYAKDVLELNVSKTAELADFADADTLSDWATAGIQWAVGAGLLKGSADTEGKLWLKPAATATRAEATAIVVASTTS
jgi:hypothetical protein